MAQSRRERERELQEIDMYDVLVPELAIPYQERLQSYAVPFLDKHVDTKVPEGRDIRRSILGNTGLIQGQTNFWDNPYQYFHPKTKIDNRMVNTTDIKSYGPTLRGAMSHGNPYSMYVNPNPKNLDKKTDADFRSSELLSHEGIHGGQILYNNRAKQKMIANIIKEGNSTSKNWKPLTKEDQPWGWMPEFSANFLQELTNLGAKTKGEYGGSGFGFDPMETVAYLAGFEGELNKGQTLKDHPVVGPLFAKYPGMYDEYVTSMERIRTHLKK